MENEVQSFCSDNIFSITIRGIILIILLLILGFIVYRFYLTYFESKSVGLVRFILICLAFDLVCKKYLGNFIRILSCLLNIDQTLMRIIDFIPNSMFSFIVLRISYLLLQIYFDISIEYSERCKKAFLPISKITLIVYAFINFFSRFALAFMNNEPWMINGSEQNTMSVLGIIYSIISLSIIFWNIFLVYFKLRKSLTSSITDDIRGTLGMYAVIYFFTGVIFWIGFIIGLFWDPFSDDFK